MQFQVSSGSSAASKDAACLHLQTVHQLHHIKYTKQKQSQSQIELSSK